ncbi:MAG: hypothetical protein J7L11_08020 [Thermoprotei archaeon]|nr:hypothetical protein [Thermoprotei archaeon]
MNIDAYRRKYAYGEDYGTSDFKFGPITLGEVPDIIENRGYMPDTSSIMYKITGEVKRVVVGPEIPFYLEAREDLTQRMVYPMRNGIVEKNDERAWSVIYEITKYGLQKHASKTSDFNGFYVTAALSIISPKYMYERIFEVHERVDEETGLVKAVTIIPQPLAVAIAQKKPTCVVLESGHGNTQISPISRYPIRRAILTINRGGNDANIITAEILKDNGYGDLAQEEKLVRMVKESIGLVPRDLDQAIQKAKEDPDRFRAVFKVPGTKIVIDLGENSWMRFLIGEYIFDPTHEIFESYWKRGMPRPRDVKVGDTIVSGVMDMADAIIEAVQRCPVELQPYLYREVLLSGGNFAWKVPEEMKDVVVDAAEKIKLMMDRKGIGGVKVTLTKDPQYSVWRGCIVYSVAVPDEYEWNWERMEGWLKLH